MIYQCLKQPVEFWIKLQKVQTETYPSLERLKRLIDHQTDENHTQTSKNLNSLNPQSSSYISPILSLEKTQKNKYNAHVNAQKRLLYHNYNKYKTIPFTYNHLFLPKEYSSSIIHELSSNIFKTVVENKNNFCFLAFGSKQAETQNLMQGKQGTTQGVYFSSLIKLFDLVKTFNQSTKFHDSSTFSYDINFFAITQTKIIDLLNVKNEIYIAQDSNSIFSKPLNFQNATQCSFSSSYQLYTTFKKVIFRKKELTSWNIFAIKVNFYSSSKTSRNKNPVNHVLLVEWVKETYNFMTLDQSRGHQRNKSSFGERSLLCLNQCILEMFKKVEARTKRKEGQRKGSEDGESGQRETFEEEELIESSNLPSFRNSLITRILKPYLVMSVCSINQEHQNDSYQTLMLGKHLSQLNSLIIEKEIPPVSSQKKSPEQDLISQYEKEDPKNDNDDYYAGQNFQTIDYPENPPSLSKPSNKRHTKDSLSFHQSIANSPEKRQKNVNKESTSHKNLSTFDPLTKQQKVRQKLISLLEESKQKKQIQNTESNQFNQISKKIFQEKSKALKTKKHLNMLKIKANTKNLKAKITERPQSETQLLEQQIKRLNFDEKKLQKELSELKDTIEEKISSINSLTNDSNTPINKEKEKLSKIKLLKSHLKNQLEMTEMEINEFLEEKESIKSIYMHEIGVLGNHQKEILKRIEMQKNGSIVQKFNHSKDKKSLPKVRLTKQMEPFYKNSLGSRVRESLTIDKERMNTLANSPQKSQNETNRYSTEPTEQSRRPYQLQKSMSHKKKQTFETLDAIQVHKLKQERLLIRKRMDLKEKINKSKVEYQKFLEDNASKYLSYNPKRRQSTN